MGKDEKDLKNFQYNFTQEYNWQSAFDGSYIPIRYEWIDELIKLIDKRPVLEIFSGKGFLANVLRNRGKCDVIATDNFDWANCGPSVKLNKMTREEFLEKFSHWSETINVNKIDCSDAIMKYHGLYDVLLMCYPPKDLAAYQALMTLKRMNPECEVIFLGNINSCGGKEFFEHYKFEKVFTIDKNIVCLKGFVK